MEEPTTYRADLTLLQKMDYIEQHGKEAYDQLPLSRSSEENKIRRSRMTPREKVQYIEQHGNEAYSALPWD